MTPLVGRMAEQRRIAALVHAVRSGRTQILLISGPPGVGKSYLAGSVSSAMPTYTHLLLEPEADVQFGAIDRLLDEQLPETARELVALRGTAGIPTFAIGIVNLIEQLDGPFAVVVDDLDFLDQGSQEAFWHVLRRLDHVPALFIGTMRNLSGPFATRLLQHINVGRRGAHIELGPLDADEVQAFFRSTLFAPLEPRQLAAVLRATGGSPRMLCALVERIREGSTGSLTEAIDALSADASTVSRAWPEVVGRLAPAERTALLAIALGGPLTSRNLGLAMDLLGVDAPDLGVLYGTGLLNGQHLMLREVAIAPALEAMSSPEEVLRVHDALGKVLAGMEKMRHRVAALDGRRDAQLGADLMDSAGEAARSWDLVLAFRLASWACTADPSLLPAAFLHALHTRSASLAHSLETQARALFPGPTRAVLLAALESQGPDVMDLSGVEGLRVQDLDDTLLLVLAYAVTRVGRTRACMGSPRMPTILGAVRDELAARIAHADDEELRTEQDMLHRMLRMWATFEDLDAPDGGFLRAVDANVEALSALPASSPARAAVLAVAARCNHMTLRNTTASDLLAGLSRLVFVPPVLALEGGMTRFRLAFMTADWDVAQTTLENALSQSLDDLRDVSTLEAQALSALVPICRGEVEVGNRTLDHVGSIVESRRFNMAAAAVLWTRGWSATAAGDARTAADSLTRLWASPLTGVFAGAPTGVLRVRAHAALGEMASARSARDELLAMDLPDSAARYLRHHCDAVIAANSGETSTAAAAFATAGLALEDRLTEDGEPGLLLMKAVLAEDWAGLLAAAESGAPGRAECRGVLGEAVALLIRAGAQEWRQRIETLLDDVDSMPSPGATQAGLDGFDALTMREREIADLVLTGASNKEIAAKLFVSVRTVEFHVRNVLAKIGVVSRVELRARLQGRD